MPFPFVYLCDLLNDLERPHVSRYPMLPKDLANYTKDKVIRWLRLHRDRLNAFSTDSTAVMSMLQPENQTDRVYGLDARSLELVIARALQLPRPDYLDLQRWKTEPAQGDLGACVKRIMENMDTMATPGQVNSVMIEEIDHSLLRIAAFDKRSSPAVQSLASGWPNPDGIESLANLFQRLQGREAKWLTRLILKSYAPIRFPENLEPGPQHSFLPTCVQLKIQFPTSSAPPVRRDGTKMVIGSGEMESTISPLPRTAQPLSSPATPLATTAETTLPSHAVTFIQPASSLPGQFSSFTGKSSSTPASSGSRLTSTTSPLQPTSSARSTIPAYPQTVSTPASSLPIATPMVQSSCRSPSTSIQSSTRSVPRASQYNQPCTPSRTALGALSQNIPTSSPRKSPTRLSPGASIFTGGSGTCQYAAHLCPLSTCIFILGPCISNNPYIKEQLLSWHGSYYTTSIRALAHPALRMRCSRTGKKFRKIALIEPRSKEATVEFLNRITKLMLMRKGRRESVEVYDWRLLEYATKMDLGKEFSYDPWARSWICKV